MTSVAESGAIDYFSSGHRLRAWATKRAVVARLRMYRMFEEAVAFDASTTVLDVGVTPDTSLADSNFFEQHYPHTSRITATSIEDASVLEEVFPGLRFVRTTGVTLPFDDSEFDMVVCTAVLEHVGSRARQQLLVDELLRVGRRVFLTTPNRWFPLELHTFLPVIHWLPQRWHQAILRAIGKDFWASTDNLNLVGAGELNAMFIGSSTRRLVRHRTAGLTSNLVMTTGE